MGERLRLAAQRPYVVLLPAERRTYGLYARRDGEHDQSAVQVELFQARQPRDAGAADGADDALRGTAPDAVRLANAIFTQP